MFPPGDRNKSGRASHAAARLRYGHGADEGPADAARKEEVMHVVGYSGLYDLPFR